MASMNYYTGLQWMGGGQAGELMHAVDDDGTCSGSLGVCNMEVVRWLLWGTCSVEVGWVKWRSGRLLMREGYMLCKLMNLLIDHVVVHGWVNRGGVYLGAMWRSLVRS